MDAYEKLCDKIEAKKNRNQIEKGEAEEIFSLLRKLNMIAEEMFTLLRKLNMAKEVKSIIEIQTKLIGNQKDEIKSLEEMEKKTV